MASGRRQYPFHLIEPKWQRQWDAQGTFRAWNPGEKVPAGHPFAERHQDTPPEQLPKYYILDMFPYPSGAGLHVGHPEGYTATDILARYQRARGLHVLHPMGWDAFGLPAEQYAIEHGRHPRVTTEQNVANFKRQIKSLGFSYDWTREVNTTDPDYFKWSQWIFLKLYNSWFNPETNKAEPIETLAYPPELQPGHPGVSHAQLESQRRAHRDSMRLAYISHAPVWWCERLGTVLANEEVIDGKSERGGFPVVRKPMRQWMLRITAYAERLLADLDTIEWSDSLKLMQRNWIGRSEGAEVDFEVAGSPDKLRVFTTRPDTLFGATYMVIAPEHALVERLTTQEQRAAVEAYRVEVAKKSDRERTEEAKEKTGVFTGAYAINPVNNQRIPIWIADYVLISYGTGAIMAVPGHDTRDFEFATKFNLPIVQVVQPPEGKDWRGYVEDGSAVNSANPEISLNGLATAEAKRRITTWLESKKLGEKAINYKLRDWLFSRQRYWGEPFPIIWKTDASGQTWHEALTESALPVLPPSLDDYKPTPDGQPPLARAQGWVNLPDGATRETNTMPQWAGSCWYYLRYLDARNSKRFVGEAAERYWMGTRGIQGLGSKIQGSRVLGATPGVDLYVGGTEHAVLHLLYARFWHKVLFDLGYVSTAEPFYKLVNQGLILGEVEFTAFSFADGRPCSISELRDIEEEATEAGRRMIGFLKRTGEKIVGRSISEEEVEKVGEGYVLKGNPKIRVDARSLKMSKSRGNTIDPKVVLDQYGADAFRLYEMFLGPLEMTKPWSTKNVEGVYRFLGRVWRLFVDEASETEFEQNATAEPAREAEFLEKIQLNPAIQDVEPTAAQLKTLHAAIKKVTEDLHGLRFNTGISALMVFMNEAITWEVKPAKVLRDFLILLQPFAPHLAEELWAKLHASRLTSNASAAAQPAPRTSPNLAYTAWPSFNPALLVEDTIEIPVQVNGKLRDVVKIAANATQADLEAAALKAEKAQAFIAGKAVRKIIVVPRKLVNIVVAG
jgi:leucyl-tRNA synthetase